MKNFSIKKQLITKYISIFLVFAAVFLLMSINIAKQALIRNSEVLFSNFALEVANNISDIIDLEMKNVKTVSNAPILQSPEVSTESKLEYLRKIVEIEGYKKAALIDLNGVCTTINGEEVNVADRDYFIASLNGETFFSAPFVSKADGGLQIAITSPIKDGNKIIGVLFFSKDAEAFSDITNSISFGNTGSAYVIDENGTNIINQDITKVIDKVNRIEDAKTDSQYAELAAITEKMIAGEAGTGSYMLSGTKKFLGYAPITIKGWSLGITTETEDMLSGLSSLKLGMILAMLLIIAGMVLVSYWISSTLSKRLISVEKDVQRMALGDLTLEQRKHTYRDEISNIDDAVQQTKASVGKMIATIQSSSQEALNQYAVLSKASTMIGTGIENINTSIDHSTQTCEEQANELSQINTILLELDTNINENASKILSVNEKSAGISNQAKISCEDMNILSQSINTLNTSFINFSHQINEMKVNMKTIDEMTELINSISEQTNLLALNAAIEAARAGEAGKGFSVVAEQIRHLAEQSKSSAANITQVITNLLNKTESMVETSASLRTALESGNENVHTTIQSFSNIINDIEEITPMIKDINENFNIISRKKDTIVTQIGTATASSEEMTAASEEILAATVALLNNSQEIQEINETVSQLMHNNNEALNKFNI